MNVYLYQNNTEKILQNAYIGDYQWLILPTTVCYYPFIDNNTDATWQTTLSSWWTKQTLWYRFSWSSAITLWGNKLSVFSSFWIKPNSIGRNANALVWATDKWGSWYNVSHIGDYRNCAQFKTWWGSWYKSSTLWTVWQWMHLALWFNWTQAYVYKNWVKQVIVETSTYADMDTKSFLTSNGWEYNFDIAYFIADWTDREADIITFYNLTKSEFWL